ncbi:HD domain-containing protein [Bacillus alveayuensis]|uniref:HD domain-containing protein n=1 Tax=Aeribacillus alveayuensis TaxID=279215 RepID=UPI0005CCE513|nr:HD domain-containing protein [Bacillus alveayuensis]
MDKREIIEKTEQYVRMLLENDASGHDWWHIERVRRISVTLAKKEHADELIVEMAALLHDVADEKIAGSEEKGLSVVAEWLEQMPLSNHDKQHIIEIISSVSFKGGNGKKPHTIEGMIVQDADRLDAIGAIGIARTFMYAGSRGHLMYDPSLPYRENMTKEEYRQGRSTAINHFYEKLLKLKELMNTESAKQIAIKRHEFMERFLQQFYKEWDEQYEDVNS